MTYNPQPEYLIKYRFGHYEYSGDIDAMYESWNEWQAKWCQEETELNRLKQEIMKEYCLTDYVDCYEIIICEINIKIIETIK